MRFKYHEFRCAHHPGYLMGGTGKRKTTHTRSGDCAVTIEVKARKRGNFLEVTTMDPVTDHKHERSREIWEQYPEIRVLSKGDQERVVELKADGASNRAVLNRMRKESGKSITINS